MYPFYQSFVMYQYMFCEYFLLVCSLPVFLKMSFADKFLILMNSLSVLNFNVFCLL